VQSRITTGKSSASRPSKTKPVISLPEARRGWGGPAAASWKRILGPPGLSGIITARGERSPAGERRGPPGAHPGRQETPAGAAQGFQVKAAFFSQESQQNVAYNSTVWEETRAVDGKASDLELRSLLGAFLFSGDDIHKPVSVLSGGEKSRLALVKILLQDSNCLILDEPTNHLDLKTKDMFQNALLQYSGTIVLVRTTAISWTTW
jgi:hypothetical protein